MLAQEYFHAQGDPMAVRSLLEESLALNRETGDKSGIANCLGLSAQVALSQGDVATARRLAEESVALQREIGNQQAWRVAVRFRRGGGKPGEL